VTRRLLLDTNIWLWSLLEPKKLSASVAKALRSAGTELWLSPISVWEVRTLCAKGRLALQPDPGAWLRTALARNPCREAALSFEIALATEDVTLPHGDPADRFLASTARVLQLELVTADENLLRGSGYRVMGNR
jgi:PIN domain nuclease of toxin-antitoxin system